MQGIILYGPPASGKDTVSEALHRLSEEYESFPRIKVGSGSMAGYRFALPNTLDLMRSRNDIIWENHRYGSTYAVDRQYLKRSLSTEIPVIHLGQVEAVYAVKSAFPEALWLVVELWCPKEIAAARIIGRGSTDLDARLKAWDETEPLPDADLAFDTTRVPPAIAALSIDSLRRSHG